MRWLMYGYLAGVLVAWVMFFIGLYTSPKADLKGSLIGATAQAPFWPMWLIVIVVSLLIDS